MPHLRQVVYSPIYYHHIQENNPRDHASLHVTFFCCLCDTNCHSLFCFVVRGKGRHRWVQQSVTKTLVYTAGTFASHCTFYLFCTTWLMPIVFLLVFLPNSPSALLTSSSLCDKDTSQHLCFIVLVCLNNVQCILHNFSRLVGFFFLFFSLSLFPLGWFQVINCARSQSFVQHNWSSGCSIVCDKNKTWD